MDDEQRAQAATVLAAHEATILASWTQAAVARLAGRMTRQELEAELRSLYASIARGAARDGAEQWDETLSLLAEVSRSRARQGFSPTETAASVFSLKDAVVPLVEDGTLVLGDLLAVTALVDELGTFTFDTYVRAREQVILQQSDQLLELSTPVIKLWDGIVALPLIGTLDSARTQVVMENLLQALVETGSEHAIIDITGVPAVDTQVAQHLFKTIIAARLMGAECVVSGIRPQIAQTIVTLGIEFGDIVTKASLADALALCLRRRGVILTQQVDRTS